MMDETAAPETDSIRERAGEKRTILKERGWGNKSNRISTVLK